MNSTDETTAIVEKCREIYRGAAIKLAGKGIEPIDIAIAGVYFTHDTALAAGHDPHGAIEWMRTALDDMERQLAERAPGSKLQ